MVLVLFLLPAGYHAQEEILKEKVAVINVEVPVRVFYKGVALATLTRDDFRLFEDGEPQSINGFEIQRKKIKVQKVNLKTEAGTAATRRRYFVLIFRIFDYNDRMQQAVQYIFDHLLDDNDQLLLFVNDRTLALNQDVWQVKRHQILDQILHDESMRAKQNLENYFQIIHKNVDQTRLLALSQRDQNFFPPNIIQFLENYLETWKEFKKKYLIPDLDKFYNFAHYLEKVNYEKWVLMFYQIEQFPNLKIAGQIRNEIEDLIGQLQVARSEDSVHAEIIDKLLTAIDHSLNAADDFPVEEVSKLLAKVDTTYHCFISTVQREAMSPDLDFKRVASDIESSMREITHRSGGQVLFGGDFVSGLHAIEEREDVCYLLTYEPKNPQKKGKISIKVSDPRYKLYYDDNIRADYINDYLKKKAAADPTIQLDNLALTARTLQLQISNFVMTAVKHEKYGQLAVIVQIRDFENQKVYDQSRAISAKEPTLSISIDCDWLKPGKYMFLVEARDLTSGRTAMDILQTEVK